MSRASEGSEADLPTPEPAGAAPRSGSRLAAALISVVREVGLVLLLALGLSWLVKTLLMQAFFIPSESMEDTLIEGDRVLVSKLTPGPFELRRGDVVVFSDTEEWLPAEIEVPEGWLGSQARAGLETVGLLPAAADEHLIKRLIGLPGDTVVCCDDSDRLTVNGVPIEEPYLKPGDAPSDDRFSVTVPPGRIWVLGDHRSGSADSRAHRDSFDGTIAMSDVVGRAFVRIWPLDRAGLLRNPASSFDAVR